jgi:hypothetical protein
MKKPLVAAAIVAGAMIIAPAGAQSADAPAPGCFGLLFKDKAGDAVSAGPGAAQAGNPSPENLDLTEGWVNVDGTGSAINMRVKNLTKDVPNGATAIVWQANYVGKAGTAAWVRAITDFSGIISYDYGGVQDTPAIPFNVRSGGTTGNFLEGENGVVTVYFPEAVEPKGTQLKSFNIVTEEAVQALPGAAPTPVKGGSLYEDDNASGGKNTFTIGGACPAAVPAAPATTTGTPATPGQPVAQTQDGPLPVKVTTTKFKAKKVKKGMSLKLSSTEPITQLAAQIKKGKKVLGKGTLAKLDGKGTLKLKAKGLKKGTYVLDLAGTDAKGARRFTAANIKVG